MEIGCFYFIEDSFFTRYNDCFLMGNKEKTKRPCYYAFLDEKTQLYWFIPISSKINKYELIYQNKITKYGFCNTIVFGEVLGNKSAFLIQNMFPSKSEYIQDIYIHRNVKVKISGELHKDIVKKAK